MSRHVTTHQSRTCSWSNKFFFRHNLDMTKRRATPCILYTLHKLLISTGGGGGGERGPDRGPFHGRTAVCSNGRRCGAMPVRVRARAAPAAVPALALLHDTLLSLLRSSNNHHFIRQAWQWHCGSGSGRQQGGAAQYGSERERERKSGVGFSRWRERRGRGKGSAGGLTLYKTAKPDGTPPARPPGGAATRYGSQPAATTTPPELRRVSPCQQIFLCRIREASPRCGGRLRTSRRRAAAAHVRMTVLRRRPRARDLGGRGEVGAQRSG